MKKKLVYSICLIYRSQANDVRTQKNLRINLACIFFTRRLNLELTSEILYIRFVGTTSHMIVLFASLVT